MITVVLEKPKKGESFGGQVGRLVGDLDDDVVDKLRMRTALERFARQIIKQMPPTQRRILSVELHGIEFTFKTGGKK